MQVPTTFGDQQPAGASRIFAGPSGNVRMRRSSSAQKRPVFIHDAPQSNEPDSLLGTPYWDDRQRLQYVHFPSSNAGCSRRNVIAPYGTCTTESSRLHSKSSRLHRRVQSVPFKVQSTTPPGPVGSTSSPVDYTAGSSRPRSKSSRLHRQVQSTPLEVQSTTPPGPVGCPRSPVDYTAGSSRLH